MFVLAELKDFISLSPDRLDGYRLNVHTNQFEWQQLDLEYELINELDRRYSNKVINEVGLGISVKAISGVTTSNIIDVQQESNSNKQQQQSSKTGHDSGSKPPSTPSGLIHRTDGGRRYFSQVEFSVTFQLIVFRPQIDEVIEGYIESVDHRGLIVSLKAPGIMEGPIGGVSYYNHTPIIPPLHPYSWGGQNGDFSKIKGQKVTVQNNTNMISSFSQGQSNMTSTLNIPPFFDNILVPRKSLQEGSLFNTNLRRWAWIDPPESEPGTKLDYTVGERIRVKVEKIKFFPEEQTSQAEADEVQRVAKMQLQTTNSANGPGPPAAASGVTNVIRAMCILARCDQPGLGLVSWWDEEDDEDEDSNGGINMDQENTNFDNSTVVENLNIIDSIIPNHSTQTDPMMMTKKHSNRSNENGIGEHDEDMFVDEAEAAGGNNLDDDDDQ